jgi:hypothetical protein
MALYFFINFLRTDLFSGTYLVMSEQIALVTKFGYIISKLTFLTIIYFLWFRAAQISSIINRSLHIENLLEKEIDYRNLFQLLVALTGIIILATGVPDFIEYILESSSARNINFVRELPTLIPKIIELAIGTYLFLKAHKLTKYTFERF